MSRSAGRERSRGGFAKLDAGDLFVLINDASAGGPAGPVYAVAGRRGLNSWGSSPGGYCVIWTQTASSAPAPYTPDAQAAAGGLGGANPITTKKVQPQDYQLASTEIVQVRFKIRLLDTTPASGALIDMFDIYASNPGSTAAWGSNNTTAPLNARLQLPDPADAVAAATQTANMGQPTEGYASDGGWLAADRTELWWVYQKVPSFQVQWNGSGATPAGIGLALEASGYCYTVLQQPVDAAGPQRYVAGHLVTVPDGFSVDDIIPINTQVIPGE